MFRVVIAGVVALAAVVYPASASSAAVQPVSRFDFDGDGRDDLVAGAGIFADQGAPAGTPSGGGYVVDYSTRSTLDFLTPGNTGLRFLGTPVAGNFNGDAYADLAAVYEGVRVLSGSPTGLLAASAQQFAAEGSAIAAGDINGDGYDDIAVGAPSASAVTIFYGSASGIVPSSAVTVTQDTPGVPDTAEENDRFGESVVIGDVTGDGYADLAIGAPGEAIYWPGQEDGSVTLLPGSPNGVSTSTATTVAGTRDVDAGVLGEQLLISDLNGDRRGDVLVPSPRSRDGLVVYLPGNASGLTTTGHRVISSSALGYPNDTPTAHFGYAAATGDVTGDGIADLLVSDVGRTVAGAGSAGAVFLVPGTRSGPTGAGARMFTQATGYPSPWRAGTPDSRKPQASDYFGSAITVLNLDGVGALDVVIGSRFEGRDGSPNPGLLTWLVPAISKPVPGGRKVAWQGALTTGRTLSGSAVPNSRFVVYDLGRSLVHS